MRAIALFFVAAAALATAAPVHAGAGAEAGGEEACISPQRAEEKMGAGEFRVDTVNGNKMTEFRQVFEKAYGTRLHAADSALVFLKRTMNTHAWMILFQEGCAVAEGPIGLDVYLSMTGEEVVPAPLPGETKEN